MNEPNVILADAAAVKAAPPSALARNQAWGLGLTVLALILSFSVVLYDLARFSLGSSLYSHIALVPFISLYLIWSKRQALPVQSAPARKLALLLAAAGLIVIAGYWAALGSGVKLAREESLATATISFLLLLTGAGSFFIGYNTLRAIAFPLGFLIFMVPIPTALMSEIETFMQYGSGAAAHGFFKLAGTSVFYHDLHFQLPGISLHVAPECSGIRSTLVLFMVSVLTGHLFLRSTLGCVLLSAAVLPLALLRNGFRIFTIGELCTHFGPEMIDSYIHRQGGPIFFALSLVPFLLLLAVLVRWERRRLARRRPAAAPVPNSTSPAATAAAQLYNR